MKMTGFKKRGMSFLLVVVIILSVTACGQGTITKKKEEQLDPNNPITITLWHYYVGENKTVLESAAEEFNRTVGLEKGIILQTISQGSIMELEEKITSSAKGVINADPMPDIFSAYPDKVMELDEMGVIADLNEYFDSEEEGKFIPEFIQEGIFSNNRLLLIPIVKSTEILYLNDTAWQEFSSATGKQGTLPSSWEELLDISRDYYQWIDDQTPEIPWDGKGMMGFDALPNFIVLGCRQQGIEVIDGQTCGANLAESPLRKIFDIYVGGMSLGYFDAVSKYRADDLKAGALIAYVGSTSGVSYFPTWIEANNERKKIDFVAMPYPFFQKGNPIAVQQGAGMAVSISTPQRQMASALFLKWFTDYQQNVPFAMSTGYLPVKQQAYDSDLFHQTMKSYKSGDPVKQNVAQAYDIAMDGILNGKTYTSKPFVGSYQIRIILQTTLGEAALSAEDDAKQWKQEGLSEEKILANLEMDRRFADWIEEIKSRLEEKEIPYRQ